MQNTTFNSALKQSTAIRKDLANLSNNALSDPTTSPSSSPSPNNNNNILSPAALGSLSASLTAFQKTVDEYHSLAKHELNPAKQEKANERIRNFRAELAAFRKELDALKARRDEALHTQNRGELLGQRRGYAAASDSPFYSSTSATSGSHSGLHARNTSGGAGVGGYGGGGGGGSSGLGGAGAGAGAAGYESMTREDHAFREQHFFDSTNAVLDEYMARGQAVLSDLGTQREMMKNTQKRYVVAAAPQSPDGYS